MPSGTHLLSLYRCTLAENWRLCFLPRLQIIGTVLTVLGCTGELLRVQGLCSPLHGLPLPGYSSFCHFTSSEHFLLSVLLPDRAVPCPLKALCIAISASCLWACLRSCLLHDLPPCLPLCRPSKHHGSQLPSGCRMGPCLSALF